MDGVRSRPAGIVPLPVKDVTAACITQLKMVPAARSNEGFAVPGDIPADLLAPQDNESMFLKLYVTEKIIADGKLEITSVNLYPNYNGRIFEVEAGGRKQLVLAGVSNDLDATYRDWVGAAQSFPFLVYIPPSPQDTPGEHGRLYPHLYAKTRPNDIPLFYRDSQNYPYSWDWLYFQLFANMYRLSFQLKKAKRPYVFIVPLVKSFSEGIGLLNSGDLLERCLLGIQLFHLREVLKVEDYPLIDLQHVTLASFSIGDSILSRLLLENRETAFVRDRVKDLVVLDPPFGNEKNRSPIIDTAISILRSDPRKSLFVYTQEAYYIRPLINTFLTPKGIRFDLRRDKVFADPKVKNVMFAYLEPALFQKGIQDPMLKSVHNTFPNLFINNATARSSLRFLDPEGWEGKGQSHPTFSFLEWVPTGPPESRR